MEMSADANAVMRAIKDEGPSPTLSNAETESDNSIRSGDDVSPLIPIKDEPMDVDETTGKDDDEMDNEESAKATQMLVTVMQWLDPDTVFQMQISNSSMRHLATQNSWSFTLRHIDRALLIKDYAMVSAASDDVGYEIPRIIRREKRHSETSAPLVDWFFRALRNSFVNKLEVYDVPVNKTFAMCMQKYAPTIRIKNLTYDKITLQFDEGVTYPVQGLFEHFAAVGTLDLSGSHSVLSPDNIEINDAVIAAFTANPRITSLRLPQSDGLGSTVVSSKALIDFCFHECAPEQRAMRVLDVYAPTVDQHFVQKLIARYRSNQGNAQVSLNVHHPIPEQELEVEECARIRADGMHLRVCDDEDMKILEIRLYQKRLPPPPATGPSPASVVAVSPTVAVDPPVKSEPL
ncbi:hypothetical protein AAVH_12951 [Aphelenchoides avenae]|nr:hypothetical protein AAVH_12951 [Aphelenchus avenae]